jgi:hypothetical protein
MVYITRKALKPKLIERLQTEFAKMPGVAQVITPSQYDALGYPQPLKNDRMADLVLAAKEGYAFDSRHAEDLVTDVPAGSSPGAHGYLASEPAMNAVFVAWGAGIKRGAKLQVVRTIDLAPTMAHLLGLELKGAEGRLLKDALN